MNSITHSLIQNGSGHVIATCYLQLYEESEVELCYLQLYEEGEVEISTCPSHMLFAIVRGR